MRADQAFQAALLRLLRPLVRIALRQGVAHAAFDEVVKQAYVQAAGQDAEFCLPGRKQTASRVSVLTGLTRKEVARLQSAPIADDSESIVSRNRAARVLHGWISRYKSAADTFKEIDEESFSELVRDFSGDVPVRAVLDELLRVKAVVWTPNGLLQLCTNQYVPHANDNDYSKLTLMGEHVSDLLASVDHNLTHQPDQAFFQRRLHSDNLPAASRELIRAELARHSKVLLELTRQTLAEYDRGELPDTHGRMRAGLGVYYYEEEISNPGGPSAHLQRKQS
jgi:hypothetical protein